METFLIILLIISFGLFCFFVIRSSIVFIPERHYGLLVNFTERTRVSKREGWRWKIPFIQKFLVYPAILVTHSLAKTESAVVFTKDNLEITIEGSVQLRPNFKNLFRFAEVSEDSILNGMKDAIEGGLGIIAGQEDASSFITKREEIQLLINCLFRLSRRVDYYVNKSDLPNGMGTTAYEEYFEKLKKDLPREKAKIIEKLHPTDSKWKIPVITVGGKEEFDVLGFYKANISKIVYMLELESKEQITEDSEVEELYGIDIAQFSLAKIAYSEKTKAALEAAEQEESKMKAVGEVHKKKMEIFRELVASGVSEDEALAEASAAVKDSERKTNKVSGGSTINLNNL